jgi:hypothetical protein
MTAKVCLQGTYSSSGVLSPQLLCTKRLTVADWAAAAITLRSDCAATGSYMRMVEIKV